MKPETRLNPYWVAIMKRYEKEVVRRNEVLNKEKLLEEMEKKRQVVAGDVNVTAGNEEEGNIEERVEALDKSTEK